MKWIDVTSYLHGERGKVAPRAYSIKSGEIDVVVTNAHEDYRGRWVMHSVRMNIFIYPLNGCNSLEEAKRLSIEVVRAKIAELAESAALLSSE